MYTHTSLSFGCFETFMLWFPLFTEGAWQTTGLTHVEGNIALVFKP